MKRFSFRLQPVLELRRRAEDKVKHAIAKNNNAKLQAQQQLSALGDELDALNQDESARRVSALSALILRAAVAFRHKLGSDIRAKHSQIQSIAAEGETLRKALIAARKETRALELIREKRLTEWKALANKTEQQFVDDVSQQKYIRNLHSSAGARHAAE
jgi:flagellar protein FliJ